MMINPVGLLPRARGAPTRPTGKQAYSDQLGKVTTSPLINHKRENQQSIDKIELAMGKTGHSKQTSYLSFFLH